MSTRLEQFIRDHREEFDSDEPAKKVWGDIEYQIDPAKKQSAPVVRFNFMKWSAAAAVIILVASGVWYFNTRTNNTAPIVVKNPPADARKKTNNLPPVITNDTSSKQQLAQVNTLPDNAANKEGQETVESTYKEEMYHYARLVEIKHKELKKIEKDEPLLYKQFAGDVNKLDSVYHSLQNQLPENPNREQLLEAMIQNLQLQMKLLNHQLDIIKQINHSKKSAYEKAYRSA